MSLLSAPTAISTPSLLAPSPYSSFFFFNPPPPTEIYTLSLHDALPISESARTLAAAFLRSSDTADPGSAPSTMFSVTVRSEEHTSELQSLTNLVCRLLLEKKKNKNIKQPTEHHTHKSNSEVCAICYSFI